MKKFYFILASVLFAFLFYAFNQPKLDNEIFDLIALFCDVLVGADYYRLIVIFNSFGCDCVADNLKKRVVQR